MTALVCAGCLEPAVDFDERDGAGSNPDAGSSVDAGLGADAGPKADAGPGTDGGSTADSGTPLPKECIEKPYPDGGGMQGDWCVELPANVRSCTEVTLAGCPGRAIGLAIGEGRVVWTAFDGSGSTVWALAPDGGAPLLLATQTTPPTEFAIRGGYVYWVAAAPSQPVVRVPLDGGPLQVVTPGQSYAAGIAVDDSRVFWSMQNPGEIRWAPISGGPAQVFAPGEAGPAGLALDTGYLYWANGLSGQIRRRPLDGGAASTLFNGQHSPDRLFLKDGFLYWGEYDSPANVYRASAGGGAVQVIASGQDVPRFVVSDGKQVYWLAQGQNYGQPTTRIYSAPVDGGPPQLWLTPLQGGPIAIDDAALYFGNVALWKISR